MKKRVAALHLIFFLPQLIIFSAFTLLQLYRHGIPAGLYDAALAWSLYVLCIPAAHGRVWLGIPFHAIFHRHIRPEAFLWVVAAAINIGAILFDPMIYLNAIPSYLLYRILTQPSFWPILVVSFFGTWFRVIFRFYDHAEQRALLRIVRHLLQISGILLFLYLTHYDIIILLNSVANG